MNYGRYRIIEEIGKGSMGNVYKAHDPNLDLIVALKVLRKDRVESETFVRRFIAEARVMGRLDHRNIVRVYNVDEDQGTAYIAMEYVEGDPLSALMQSRRFKPEEIVDIGASIAGTLGYAHRKGIVHRDIKPSNILIRPDGVLKITDFGIAHIQDAAAIEKTLDGEILGTPAYMSPEQVMSRQVDGRSDLFSLGIILYELCVGAKPFKGENMTAVFHAITHTEPVEIAQLNPDIPVKLSKSIMQCLRKKKEERFETGEALVEALKICLGKKEPVRVSPAAGKKRIRIAVAAAVVLLAGTMGGWGILHFRSGDTSGKTNRPEPVMTSLLTIESKPADAEVFVDGHSRGKTPARLKLSAGRHEVRMTLLRHHDWKALVQVAEDRELPLSVRLHPAE